MSVVDASAVCAIILGEPERGRFTEIIGGDRRPLISPVQVWEASVTIAQRLDLDGLVEVDRLIGQLAIEIAVLGEMETRLAFDAWRRFGKGRHPAQLNLGDCFAYGLAKARDLPLLFKGEDFAKTDIKSVL